MEPCTHTTSIVIDEGLEGTKTYVPQDTRLITITDHLGREFFRKSFEDNKTCEEFIQKNCFSFSGLHLKNQDHPLKENFKNSPSALEALERGSLTLKIQKQKISFQCSCNSSTSLRSFSAQIYTHEETHQLNTKAKLFNWPQSAAKKTMDLKHYEGNINTKNIGVISDSNRLIMGE